VTLQHLGRVTHRREVVDLVPALDQPQILQQPGLGGSGQLEPEFIEAGAQAFTE
jgi:hypothetical protein